MRVVCPACAATYAVPDHLLDGQRSVRCKRCQTSWVPPAVTPEPAPMPMAPIDQPPPPPPPATAAVEREPYPVSTPPPPRPQIILTAAWVASIAVITVGVVLLLTEHRHIASAWPAMQRVYGVIGLSR